MLHNDQCLLISFLTIIVESGICSFANDLESVLVEVIRIERTPCLGIGSQIRVLLIDIMEANRGRPVNRP